MTAKGFKFEDEALAALKTMKDFEDASFGITPFENGIRIMELIRRRPVLFIGSLGVESLVMRHGGIQKQPQIFNKNF